MSEFNIICKIEMVLCNGDVRSPLDTASSGRGDRSQQQLDQAITAGKASRKGRRRNYIAQIHQADARREEWDQQHGAAVFNVLILLESSPVEAAIH